METFGAHALNPTKQAFLDSVLRLKPRVAAFDCDGTLWSGDAGERFFDWEIKQGVVSDEVAQAMRARYVEYKAGQSWRYASGNGPIITVLKVEDLPKIGRVIHVRVDDIPVPVCAGIQLTRRDRKNDAQECS